MSEAEPLLLSYTVLHQHIIAISRLSYASRGLYDTRARAFHAEAQRRLRELLLLIRRQSQVSESPSARVAEAQLLMHRAALHRDAGEVLEEAQSYFDASSLWFRIERERRLLNFPTSDDALSSGVLCGAMGCAVLLRDAPDLRDSPMPQHAAALVSNRDHRSHPQETQQSAHVNGDEMVSPRMPRPHLTRAWAELMRIGAVLEEFQCLELAANYFELAAGILLEAEPIGPEKRAGKNEMGTNSFAEELKAAGNAARDFWERVGGAIRQLGEPKGETPSASSSTGHAGHGGEDGASTSSLDTPPPFRPPMHLYEFSVAVHRASMVCATARDYPRALLYTDTLLHVLSAETHRRRTNHWTDPFVRKQTNDAEKARTEKGASWVQGAYVASGLLPTLACLPPRRSKMASLAFLITHMGRWVQLIVLRVFILVELHLRSTHAEEETAIGMLLALADALRAFGNGAPSLRVGEEAFLVVPKPPNHFTDNEIKQTVQHDTPTPNAAVSGDGDGGKLDTNAARDMARRLLQSDTQQQQQQQQQPTHGISQTSNNATQTRLMEETQPSLSHSMMEEITLRRLALALRLVCDRAKAYYTCHTETKTETTETSQTHIHTEDPHNHINATDTQEVTQDVKRHEGTEETKKDKVESVGGARAARVCLRCAVKGVEEHLTTLGMRSRTITVVSQRMMHEVFFPACAVVPPIIIPK